MTSGTVVVAAGVAPVDWTVNGGNVIVEGSASAGDFIVNGGTVTLADGTVITGQFAGDHRQRGNGHPPGRDRPDRDGFADDRRQRRQPGRPRQHDRGVDRLRPGRHPHQRRHGRPRHRRQPRRQHPINSQRAGRLGDTLEVRPAVAPTRPTPPARPLPSASRTATSAATSAVGPSS